MPRFLLLPLVFVLVSASGAGQDPAPRGQFWDRVRFGGGIGLGITNGGFNGSIAPSAIYGFNDQFAAGASLNFNYAEYRDNTLLAYGGSVLALYSPLPFLQLSGEFEQLRINRDIATTVGILKDNYWTPALFLGIGYTNRHVTLGIRYDLLYHTDKSIYANAWMPFVRVYF